MHEQPEIPRRDAAIIVTVSALIVALIIFFLANAPTTAAREANEGAGPGGSAELREEPATLTSIVNPGE